MDRSVARETRMTKAQKRNQRVGIQTLCLCKALFKPSLSQHLQPRLGSAVRNWQPPSVAVQLTLFIASWRTASVWNTLVRDDFSVLSQSQLPQGDRRVSSCSFCLLWDPLSQRDSFLPKNQPRDCRKKAKTNKQTETKSF